MEQRTLRLNFDLSFVYGPRTWRVPFVAVMLLCAVGELNSESVTLSTYYPAPSGVYTNMITTGDTFLARDPGSKVGIGTTTPGAKLAVSGAMSVGAAYAASVPPADSMIVSGQVGIGTNLPGAKLAVSGTMSVGAYGAIVPPANSMIVSGNIGARMTGPTQAVDVSGNVHISAAGCGLSAMVANGTICAAGKYATFQSGVYTEGWSYQNIPAPYLVAPDGFTRSYRFIGINPFTGQSIPMPFGYTEGSRVVCCNK